MRNLGIVIGLGETGLPLWEILDAAHHEKVRCYDFKKPETATYLEDTYDILNICLPWGPQFVRIVKGYQKRLKPKITVIHSTVPVGTTAKFKDAVHSPILGKHGRMRDDIQTYTKWIGGKGAEKVEAFFNDARIRTTTVKTPEETELLKLMCLAKYGVSIAFAVYQKKVCDKFNVPFMDAVDWDINYNSGVLPSLKRPIIDPPTGGRILGHCVIPGTRILDKQFPSQMLKEVLRHG